MAGRTCCGGQDGKALSTPPGPGIRAPLVPLTEPNVHAGTSDRLISEFGVGKWVGLMFSESRRCKQKQTKCTGVKIRNKKGVDFNHKTTADG